MENLKNLNYKIHNIRTEYLNSTHKNIFLMVKNSLLKLENGFIGLEDEKIKDRELKMKKTNRGTVF